MDYCNTNIGRNRMEFKAGSKFFSKKALDI